MARPLHPQPSFDTVSIVPRSTGDIAPGDLVQLTDTRGNKTTITVRPGAILHTHRGQIPHDALIGLPEGASTLSTRGIAYLVQRPQLDDYVLGMPRQAAVIYPKDAARIVALADLGSGGRVLEAGVGAGALTCYLLRAVGPSGGVISVERRSDFAEQARENVARWFAGMPDSWTLIEGDLADTTPEQMSKAGCAEGLDAVVLDMLAPWECLDVADRLLRPGGALVAYVATTTQLSRLVESMRLTRRWTEPRAEESIVRTWHLDGLAVRPDHRMSGHTGFLVASRHMAPGQLAPERKRRPAPGAYGEDYAGPGGDRTADGTEPG
ncbi:MAG: tRNA (adenine-N1)-methyltransferase [Candidatus Nanopelagicales bacterium]